MNQTRPLLCFVIQNTALQLLHHIRVQVLLMRTALLSVALLYCILPTLVFTDLDKNICGFFFFFQLVVARSASYLSQLQSLRGAFTETTKTLST